MEKIESAKLIQACKAEDFQQELDKLIAEFQASGLEVEVSQSMCQAQKGIGYMYSAVVIARKA